ncbi:unnamed protein product [Eruca vesicaria subsp. sativa]|uniref:Uncharacterized protein n=1 Tax=Eruca vesicaria subsp. sativa TaxID=29727 RepID=A0ABC8IQF4_ERUVS|nr:unnamed protein product [Eruca vesicaria subsp. sativa]
MRSNQCRGGHMFDPTKIVSEIDVTAVPALGHKIENVPEMPFMVSDSAEAVENVSCYQGVESDWCL